MKAHHLITPPMSLLLPAVLLLLSHCAKEPIPFEEMYPERDASAGGDGDADADSDTDADADADTDADTNTDADSDGDAAVSLPKRAVAVLMGTPRVDGSVGDTCWSLTEPVERIIEGIGNNTIFFQVFWDYTHYIWRGTDDNWTDTRQFGTGVPVETSAL